MNGGPAPPDNERGVTLTDVADPLPTPESHPRHGVIDVTYNGSDIEAAFKPHEGMEHLLNHALNKFNIHENRHVMALWTTAGVELPITGTVAEAGIKEGELLVLRPSAVRGGEAC